MTDDLNGETDMGLLGSGAVAIWHDITPETRGDFFAWHGSEHMPERVAIPGFHRGRRYVAIDADLEFFNLYETASPSVLTSEAYRARLNDPTPWTKRAVLGFRNVARALCRVKTTVGAGQGGLIATWRYHLAGDGTGHDDALQTALKPLDDPEVTAGVLVLAADDAASGEINAEEKARGARNDVPGRVVMVEGWGDVDDLVRACRTTLAEDTLIKAGADAGTVRFGVYRLQATVSDA